MRVISRKKLREFWSVHPRAEPPLRLWEREVKRAQWDSFADIRQAFASADQVGRKIVFNIGGRKYRLIAVIDYPRHKVFVRFVLTHKQYDKDTWKDDEFGEDWKD